MHSRPKVNKAFFIALIVFILMLAFFIRYPGIDFQFPDISNPDETILVHPALKILATKNFNLSVWHPEWGLVYGPFYSYSLIFLNSLFFIGSDIFGWGFTLAGENAPLWAFYYIGRFLSLIVSLAGILLLIKLVQNTFDNKTALISAVFLATNPTYVSFSIYAKPDALMCLFLLAAIFFMLKILEFSKTKFYMLAGFFSGLAIATKLYALSIIVLIIAVHLIQGIGEKFNFKSYFQRVFLNKNIYLCFGFLFLGFFIGNPFSLLDYSEFIREVKTNFLTSGLGATGAYESTGSILKDIFTVGIVNTLSLIYSALFKTLGDGYIIFLSFLGVAYVIFRHRKRDIALLSFALLTIFMVVPSIRAGSEHHIFMANIVLILFSSMLLVEVSKKMKFFSSLIRQNNWRFVTSLLINFLIVCAVIFFAKKPAPTLRLYISQRHNASVFFVQTI
ncbi:hypothetical protein LCGC14_0800180 [marine sediment metagenome]|uniref:Glycosyltransferase RgtA/B/C/D-like domain-containing protein n=1 Tax=marine sediment metagenome TaxID=412755 RepID=A0A0F9PPX2_9ZZZZ